MTKKTPTPTLAEAATLPPTLNLRAAASWLGISPTTAYRLVEDDRFPVPVHRIGASLRVPTTALLTYLGITTTPTTPPTGPENAEHGTGTAATVGEPSRPGLRPVAGWSVDGTRAGRPPRP